MRREIGLAGQFAAVEPAMTGRENLEMTARLFGHGRRASRQVAVAVLSQLGLDEVADRRCGTYSGGQSRRLDLGASLAGAPRLLLLDEPTTGLDPACCCARCGPRSAPWPLSAPGSCSPRTTWRTQAAQGMSLIAFVFAFVSSAYVPAASMPGWLQPFAKYQPITPMVDAVRALLTGSSSDVGLALVWSGLLLIICTPIAVLRCHQAVSPRYSAVRNGCGCRYCNDTAIKPDALRRSTGAMTYRLSR